MFFSCSGQCFQSNVSIIKIGIKLGFVTVYGGQEGDGFWLIIDNPIWPPKFVGGISSMDLEDVDGWTDVESFFLMKSIFLNKW